MKRLILTIDLEWYYNGNQVGSVADFDQKSLKERFSYDNGQIEKSAATILKILKKYHQKITFFVTGELDKVYPQVLKEIANQDHEIAIHSYRHAEFSNGQELEIDLEKCLPLQKRYKAVGYRSPRIKMQPDYYLPLKKFGYQYDSSVYGTTKFNFKNIKILPLSVLPYKKQTINRIPSPLNLELLKEAIPFGGGLAIGFFQKFEKYFIDRYQKLFQKPACLFLHSWQIEKPSYPLRFLVKNPFMLPYSFECKNLLEYFCQKYQLIKIRDYL